MDFEEWIRKQWGPAAYGTSGLLCDLAELCAKQHLSIEHRRAREERYMGEPTPYGHDCRWCESCMIALETEERDALAAAEAFREKYDGH